MSTSTATVPTLGHADVAWLRLVKVCVAAIAAPLAILAVVNTFFTTVSGSDFRYAADYWLTAPGLPIALAGVGIALGVHKLQHGADGRLATVGVWGYALSLAELFVQLLDSLIVGAEVRWGPSYPVFTLLSFVGLSLLAAGSWRTGVLPRWMLGTWPLLWVIGSFGAIGPMPVLLVVFFAALAVVLTGRVRNRAVDDGR